MSSFFQPTSSDEEAERNAISESQNQVSFLPPSHGKPLKTQETSSNAAAAILKTEEPLVSASSNTDTTGPDNTNAVTAAAAAAAELMLPMNLIETASLLAQTVEGADFPPKRPAASSLKKTTSITTPVKIPSKPLKSEPSLKMTLKPIHYKSPDPFVLYRNPNTMAQYIESRPSQLDQWRTRDPIYSLLASRDQLHQSLQSTKPSSSLSKTKLKVGKDFPIDVTLEKLSKEKEKVQIMKRAFDAAALSVLKALRHEQEKQAKDSTPLALLEGNASTTNDPSSLLPCILKTLSSVQTTREECFELALNKRKRMKRDDTTSPPKKRKKTNARGPKTNSTGDVGSSKKNPSLSTPSTSGGGSGSGSGALGGGTIGGSTGGGAGNNSNIDSRATVSRAILCAAASHTFKELTPPIDGVDDIDVLDVPQNTHAKSTCSTGEKGEGVKVEEKMASAASSTDAEKPIINMGAVTMSAKIFANRSMEQARGSAKRSEIRRKWRMDCNRRQLMDDRMRLGNNVDDQESFGALCDQWLKGKNAYKCGEANLVSESDDEHDVGDETFERGSGSYNPSTQNSEWTQRCLPRMLKIMHSGSGHVVLHDMQWRSRVDRIIQVLHNLAIKPLEPIEGGEVSNGIYQPNVGPHLIVTTAADINIFLEQMAPVEYLPPNYSSSSMMEKDEINSQPFCLQALKYNGSDLKRRQLRVDHFSSIDFAGIHDSACNVIVTTYEFLIKDYTHFCQIPFQAVVLDDGMSWLGTAHYDPNGQLGKVFDMGIWSKSDNHCGLAGFGDDKWDFSVDTNEGCTSGVAPRIGLTVRHKILIAKSMHSKYRGVVYPAPAPGLLSFLIPQFADVVREEWDRSRIHTCKESMDHMRNLLCRGIVVFKGSNTQDNMFSLAQSSMLGQLNIEHEEGADNDAASDSDGTNPPSSKMQELSSGRAAREISTDEMIANGKIVQSKRFAASWLRSGSPIRHELGNTSLNPILNAIKAKASTGHVCEEVVTASSITTSGAGGAVTGPAAFKTAVRCGRTFGSEQGLRQHMAALHAPPGTWLCRSCGIDCGTSQARTHHERSCGTSSAPGVLGGIRENSSGGGIPTVGQGIGSVTSNKQVSAILGQGHDDKDKDGCFRVPGYRGIWVNPSGKHFVKIKGEPLMTSEDDSSGKISLFDNAEDAATMYDKTLKERSEDKTSELNFKSDGKRIVYEDSTATAAAGRGLEMLGGGASSVVPALSVINIKDLPKGVVPLLRDPKQTSRTGGNSKRYIYAYRGVCRQARKGHDRWQSQISFGGTNHYLGTFDSEWDAAAIYAWAHLILYGEEATKKAQKDGEEAVAAYEQEKKDIADGKIIEPPPKAAKKKKAPAGKQKTSKKKDAQQLNSGKNPVSSYISKSLIPMVSAQDSIGALKHAGNDGSLKMAASERILAMRKHVLGCTFKGKSHNAPCVPIGKSPSKIPGCAILVGLSPEMCSWKLNSFFESTRAFINQEEKLYLSGLQSEYGTIGINQRFRSVIQNLPCTIGKASDRLEQASVELGIHNFAIGASIGDIDCDIGGTGGSCSEISACISYSQSSNSFQFEARTNSDFTTLNGEQVSSASGSFPLENESICSVGSRVFVFILPNQE